MTRDAPARTVRPLFGWQRMGHRYRRWIAAALGAGSVLMIISIYEPASSPQQEVFTAARDLPAGARLRQGDLRATPMTQDFVPSGALTIAQRPIGRVLASPVREGETITDVRLIGPGLLEQSKGLVAAPVRIADAAAVRLLSVGDVVTVLAAGAGGGTEQRGSARVVAPAARVLTVPTSAPRDGLDGLGSGALIVLAVTSTTAAELAAAAVTDALSIVLRSP